MNDPVLYILMRTDMGADAVKAVEVACFYDSECGLGIDTLTLGKKAKEGKSYDETMF